MPGKGPRGKGERILSIRKFVAGAYLSIKKSEAGKRTISKAKRAVSHARRRLDKAIVEDERYG
jgi:hypothetical protein